MRDLTSNSDLNALKVPELKEELEVRGAMDKKYKLKKDLIDALHKLLVEQEASGAAAPATNGEANVDAQKETKAAEEAQKAEQTKAEREAKEKAEQEAKAKAEKEAEQEAKAKAEKEVKAKAEQEAKAKAEKEAKARAEQEAKAKAEKEAKDKAENVAYEKTEREAKAKAAEEVKRKEQQVEHERAEKATAAKPQHDDGSAGAAGDEEQRKREEEELRAKLLKSQRSADKEGGVKRSMSTEQGMEEGASDKKKRRGWGSGSAAPAALNTSMLKDILTAAVTANTAADAERPKPKARDHDDVELDYGNDEDEALATDDKKESSETTGEASASLQIVNFTRPLQLREVQELLAQYGTLVEGEDGFWMDRQKRRCLCTYETVEMAIEAKSGIHGLRFPDINPKRLEVTYVETEDLSSLRVDDVAAAPRPSAASARSGRSEPEGRPREVAKEPAKPVEPEPSADAMELDKLFNKTEAQPPIYWKPLTAEQVKEREERMGRPSA